MNSDNGSTPSPIPEGVTGPAEADRFFDPLALCPPPFNLMWREMNEDMASEGHAAAVVRLQGGPFSGTLVFVPQLVGTHLVVRQNRDIASNDHFDLDTVFAVEAEYDYKRVPCTAPQMDGLDDGGLPQMHVNEIIFRSERNVPISEVIGEARASQVEIAQRIAEQIERVDRGLAALADGVSYEEAVELGITAPRREVEDEDVLDPQTGFSLDE